MKPFGFTNEANHGKTNTTKRNTAKATTRKSPGQICVSPAEKTAKQHKKGAGATTNKKPHKSMGVASDTIGLSPPCLRNMHKRINSLRPKQIKRGEAKQL